MTTSRSSESLIQELLADGLTELPDRTFDAVRHDIHRTRQRVVIGPWKEPTMSTIARLAIAAALVVAVGFAWASFGPTTDVGAPTTPPPTPTPELITGRNRPLQPGRYAIQSHVGQYDAGGPMFEITVPAAGWTSYDNFAVDRNYGATAETAGASFVIWNITTLVVDPCTDHTARSPRPGTGIDELLDALANQSGLTAGPLTGVTIDGYTGKFVELTVATDIATCPLGFHPWLDKFVQGNDEVLRVYALDVEGERVSFFARIPAITTANHKAELESVIDSIDIEPRP